MRNGNFPRSRASVLLDQQHLESLDVAVTAFALAVVDREHGERANLAADGIEFRAVYTSSELAETGGAA